MRRQTARKLRQSVGFLLVVGLIAFPLEYTLAAARGVG